MAKSEWWSTMSDSDGKTYYFKRDSRGKAHRVSKDAYNSHLKQDVPEFEEDGVSPYQPRYWSVGSTSKNGESKYVVMRKTAGDSNVYTLDPNDIHGDLANDAAAMKRIGSIINKHKATLRAADPRAEIPDEVSYNLNSSLALSTPSLMTASAMSVPTISADAINTSEAFNMPYSTLTLTNLREISIPISSVKRRTCMDVVTAQKDAEKYNGDSDSFFAKLGDNSDYVLTIQTYDETAYNTTEKILTEIAPKLYPVLVDHWHCDASSSSYWLYNVKGLTQIKDEDMVDEEKKDKINRSAKQLVIQATYSNIYLGKTEGQSFTTKDFLQKPDGSLLFWRCCSVAYFPEPNRVSPAGSGLSLVSNNSGTIPGDWLKATTLNAEAIARGVVIAEPEAPAEP
jgi:hypothetical protein